MNTERLRCFKNKGRDQETMRRRRTEVSVELRKQKKDDGLFKRRNVDEDDLTSPLQQQNKMCSMPLEDMVMGIKSEDEHTRMLATQSIRKLLSRERNPPIDAVISAGVVPDLILFLQQENIPLQFEACWALTNIASGTSSQTKVIVAEGAVPHFIMLMCSPHSNVAEQAVWALGNIAGDGPSLRDYLIECGVVKPLLNLIGPDISASFRRNITWTLSNLCRNKNPPPPFDVIKECLPTFANLVYDSDSEVVTDACWAISYLTDGSNEKIQEVIDTGIVPRLVELLELETPSIVSPALRSVGNIVTGLDDQTQTVIDAGALPTFRTLLRHSKSNIVKETTWAVSNITAGNTKQIQAAIDNGLLDLVIEVLSEGDYKCQKEAAWAVTNVTSGGTLEQIIYLVRANALEPMCNLLASKEPKILNVLLDGIANILNNTARVHETDNICYLIEQCGGLDKIEALQQHENTDVYRSALTIIETFFQVEDEDEEVAPDSTNNRYNFSASPNTPTGGFSF